MKEGTGNYLGEGQAPELEQCNRCGHYWLVRRRFCPRCGNTDTRIEAVSGAGTVHAVTMVHRAIQESAIGPAPYRIVLVKLSAYPDVTIMALAPEPLRIGEVIAITRHGAEGAPYLAWPART